MDDRRLTDPGSPALRAARLEVHYAAQLAAAPGKALAEPEDDYGHTALAWEAAEQALAGPELPGGARGAIRPADLTLLVLGDDGAAELPLRGVRLADGLAWIADQVGGATLAPVRSDLPHHDVADGAPFGAADPASLAEIAGLFAGTAPLLAATRARAVGTPSPVRCWPHHFDIAFLDVLDPDLDPEDARSLGYGMTPGDDQYPDPYWYVTPWPYPPPEALADLPHGSWHTEGWVGAVLPAAEVVAAASQAGVVARFLAAAGVAAGRALDA